MIYHNIYLYLLTINTKTMKYLIFLLPILISCQNPQSDNFNFSYLENSNPYLKDSTLLKFQLYFDKISYESCSYYLESIDMYKKNRNKQIKFNSLEEMLQVYDVPYRDILLHKQSDYIPRRLKRIRGNLDRYETIDTLFYESLTINGIDFLVESHFNAINSNYIRREYFSDINSILLFQYDREIPYHYINNKLYLNIDFTNLSKYEIDYFKGDIMITDNNNENILTLELDSRHLNDQEFKSPFPIEYWEGSLTYRRVFITNFDGSFFRLNDYSKNILENNRGTRLVFIPTEIKLKDGKIMKQ
jgi:hypothetical protein